VNGLDEIFAHLHSEGRHADQETAKEAIEMLEAHNYIPSSEVTRREYAYVLLREYREYMQNHAGDKADEDIPPRL
jgi:hypothetical protein